MANSFDYVGVLFGISYLGAIPVLYNGRFKAREIAHVTSDADIKVIITSDQIDEHTDYGELLHSALPGLEEYRFGMERPINKNTPNLEAAVMFGEKEMDGFINQKKFFEFSSACLLYTSPSPRDRTRSRMPSSA